MSSAFSYLDETFPPGLVELLQEDKDCKRYIIYDNSINHEKGENEYEWHKMRADFTTLLRMCKELSMGYFIDYTNSIYRPDDKDTPNKPPAGANMLCTSLLKCAAYIRSISTTTDKKVRVIVLTQGTPAVDGNLLNVLQTFNGLPVSFSFNLYCHDRHYRRCRSLKIASEWYSLIESSRNRSPGEFSFHHDVLFTWDYEENQQFKYQVNKGTAFNLCYGYPIHLAKQLGLELSFPSEEERIHEEKFLQLMKMIYGTKLVDTTIQEISKETILDVPSLIENLTPKLKPTYSVRLEYSNLRYQMRNWFEIVRKYEFKVEGDDLVEPLHSSSTKWWCCLWNKKKTK